MKFLQLHVFYIPKNGSSLKGDYALQFTDIFHIIHTSLIANSPSSFLILSYHLDLAMYLFLSPIHLLTTFQFDFFLNGSTLA